MKNTGLKNRFSEETRNEWTFWYECMVCHLNNWNALHHIISPSLREYVPGEHNESVFNSCPIHNYRHPNAEYLKSQGYKGKGIDSDCHINNEVYLAKYCSLLLIKVKQALDDIGYQYKPNDLAFLKVYKKLYGRKT